MPVPPSDVPTPAPDPARGGRPHGAESGVPGDRESGPGGRQPLEFVPDALSYQRREAKPLAPGRGAAEVPRPRGMIPLMIRVWATGLLLLVLCRVFLFTTYKVSGSSMVEALLDGDRILVAEVTPLIDPLVTGDTVVFAMDREVLVKRIVAGPGDRVAMEDGRIRRNGALVPEDIPSERDSHDTFPEYLMQEQEYFMLGDNRRVSIDSRDFGPVDRTQVLGKVFLRFTGEGMSGVSALARRP